MKAIFVRHAEAESGTQETDASRKLTKQGRKDARVTALALKEMGAKPGIILTSPLDRAAETAAILEQVLGNPEVQTVDFLAPPADAKALAEKLAELRQAGVAEVALVGHAPSLDQCISHLLIGSARLHVELSKSGAACVEWPDAPAASNSKPELRWLLRRQQLAAIGKTA